MGWGLKHQSDLRDCCMMQPCKAECALTWGLTRQSLHWEEVAGNMQVAQPRR